MVKILCRLCSYGIVEEYQTIPNQKNASAVEDTTSYRVDLGFEPCFSKGTTPGTDCVPRPFDSWLAIMASAEAALAEAG